MSRSRTELRLLPASIVLCLCCAAASADPLELYKPMTYEQLLDHIHHPTSREDRWRATTELFSRPDRQIACLQLLSDSDPAVRETALRQSHYVGFQRIEANSQAIALLPGVKDHLYAMIDNRRNGEAVDLLKRLPIDATDTPRLRKLLQAKDAPVRNQMIEIVRFVADKRLRTSLLCMALSAPAETSMQAQFELRETLKRPGEAETTANELAKWFTTADQKGREACLTLLKPQIGQPISRAVDIEFESLVIARDIAPDVRAEAAKVVAVRGLQGLYFLTELAATPQDPAIRDAAISALGAAPAPLPNETEPLRRSAFGRPAIPPADPAAWSGHPSRGSTTLPSLPAPMATDQSSANPAVASKGLLDAGGAWPWICTVAGVFFLTVLVFFDRLAPAKAG